MANPEDIGGQPIEVPAADQKERGKLQAQGTRESGLIEDFWAALWGGLVEGLNLAITFLATLFDELMTIVAKFMLTAQAEQTSAFYDLTAAVTGDLLGIEPDAEVLKQARFGGGRLDAMQAVGEQLFNLLGKEFLSPEGTSVEGKEIFKSGGGIGGLQEGEITPEQGVIAARRFLGFVMAFAIRQGNVSVLTDALSLHWLEHFRDYGEMMAKNLGLGRLVRLAMRPVMRAYVSDPLEKALNKQYRPTGLPVSDAVKAWLAGFLKTGDLNETLARAGFSDDLFDGIRRAHSRPLAANELLALRRAGLISGEELDRRLGFLGLFFDERDLFQKADDAEQTLNAARRVLDVSIRQLLEGVITREDFTDRLTRFNPGDAERELIVGFANTLLAAPRRRLSLTQVRQAFVHGTIDISEFNEFLTDQGYKASDRQILTIEVLLQAAKEAERKKAQESHPARRQAATGTPPPSGERRRRPQTPTTATPTPESGG